MRGLPNRHPSPLPTDREAVVPAGMRRHCFAAMGTTIECIVPATPTAQPEHDMERLFATWESTLSRFRPTSELSRLNQRTGVKATVSPLLGAVLAAALQAAEATDGIYDPTLLPQLRAVGYDRSFELVVDRLPTATTVPTPGGGWRDIRYDAHRHTVQVPPGVQLDFGGIAKGMAVDAALALLKDAGVVAALVNAGGDLGVIGLPYNQDHWPVAAPDGTVLALRTGALATSGIERHRWRQGDALRHHLLDPRTGAPAQNELWAVTVAADYCVQAEVAAKVAFILGFVAGKDFLEHHHLAGVLLAENGVLIGTQHWPQEAL